ncbi:MAG: DUF177 domain-containing protein [Candidatus Eisenbacteria bacterium]|nr:DUF177 domain-containing protein [Candidatus Eisenbacteria bacterium]
MTIHIADLHEGLNTLEIEDSQAGLGIEHSIANFAGPLRLKVSLVKTGEEVVIDGTISGELLDECSRCLAELRRPLSVALHIFGLVKKPSVSGLELDEAQPDRYTAFHDGKTIDIGDQIRESILLSLPIKRLCRPDCRGICPKCGADLNNEPCRCAKPETDERWRPLEKFLRREGGELDGAS